VCVCVCGGGEGGEEGPETMIECEMLGHFVLGAKKALKPCLSMRD